MNVNAPTIVLADGRTFTLDCDGHPDRFTIRHGESVGARWRYTLDELGEVERIDTSPTPRLWLPHSRAR